MPLYIKDPEVDKLTEELIGLTKSTKVEAVKVALMHEIESRKTKLHVRDRLAKTLAMAREAGPMAHLDHKQVTDELWGDD